MADFDAQPHAPANEPAGLSACCRASAGRYLRRHRDVATCDTCGMLLLGYGNDRDFHETQRALTEHRVRFAVDRQGALRIVAKPRPPRAQPGTRA